jgi:hypothetical protein
MDITLSGGIPTWFVDQFSETLYHVCQQKESKFAQAVRTEAILNAEDKAFDMMDEFTLTEKSGRSPDTPVIDPSTQRRWVSTTPYHNAVLFDTDDDLSMILDPTSDFVTAFRRAVNRQKDSIIYAAFEANVTSGRRAGSSITWANSDGNTSYTGDDTGRTIIHDCSSGNCSASDTGMTTEKAELAQEYFAFNDVDEDIPRWCAISPRQATNLWGQEEYVNRDYGPDTPLARGYIRRNWMGFNWIVSNFVTLGSNNDIGGDTNVYECWAWAQDAIILGIQDNVTVKISDRADKSHSQQVYVHMNMGAMRMDEDKVIKIECQA